MEPLDLNLEAIPDPATRAAVLRLLNLVEQLAADNQALRADNQRLRDEIHRLKGERGRPLFAANRSPKPPAQPTDHSSEAERREPKAWQKSAKRDQILIDRTEVLPVDKALLPPDAEFKGYDAVVVQDLVLRTDNVQFLKEVYYSPAQGKTFRAPLPPGYDGQFGPGIRALALVLAYSCHVGEQQIHTLFSDAGIRISSGTVAGFLIHDQEPFHAEAAAVLVAGLGSSPWQHLDDTSTRVAGVNQVCYILCNPLYTAYLTRGSKARLTVLSVLQGGGELRYRLDATALAYLETVGLSRQLRQQLAALARARGPDAGTREAGGWDETAFLALLGQELPRAGPQQRQRLLEAGAVAAYRRQTALPVVQTLVCDDAPQFRLLTLAVGLCWVHEGRHYAKLLPYPPKHRERVAQFRQQYWEFYHQ